MKPHLSVALMLALAGVFHAQAVEIPDGYTTVELTTPSALAGYGSNGSADKYAFILGGDMGITPADNEAWTATAPLVSGGNLLFATGEEGDLAELTFSGGASAAFKQPASLTIDTLSGLIFSEHSGTADGGAIDLGSTGKLSICNVDDGVDNPEVADVVFTGNKVTGATKGGAIVASGAYYRIEITGNGGVSFSGNSVHTSSSVFSIAGGAINSAGTLAITDNEDVSFSGNYVSSDAYVTTNSYGGAIYSSGTVTITGNRNVSFCDNYADSLNSTKSSNGGAIVSTGTVSIKGNADVTFSGNYASRSRGSGTTCYGGAIYSTGTVDISNNADVDFTGNFVSQVLATQSYGGAIYSTKAVTINNNADVSFIGNYTRTESCYNYNYCRGGAIYATGAVTIAGNDSVIFEKNYEQEGTSYRLRSIVMEPKASTSKLVLSAKTGGHITFNDSVYMGSYSGATVSFNADYTDADGVAQKAQGDIIFSGLHTAEHLREIKGGVDGTATEITNSQTSQINNLITLYGGSLQVVDGAKLNGKGLTVAAGSEAKVLLRDASLTHSGSNFTFNSGTTLELQGVNSISGWKLIMESGSALSVHVGADNLNDAVLTMGSTDLVTSVLTLNLNLSENLGDGMYKIISQKSASDFTPAADWSAENVTVTLNGSAAGDYFDKLIWQDGTLFYNQGCNVWSGGEGTNTLSEANGQEIYFMDAGAGLVKVEGDVSPAEIIVNNSEGKDYSLAAAETGGRLVGDTDITKNGEGALTLATANTHTGTTALNEGTLNLHHSSALGESTLTTAEDTTMIVDNNSHVVLTRENDIAGKVEVAAGSTLELRSSGFTSYRTEVDGALVFNGEAATTEVNRLVGTGTVSVNDSKVTFKYQSSFTGSLEVNGADASLTINNGNYTGAGTLSATGNGATLSFASNNITLQSGGQIKLSADSTAKDATAATLTARNVTVESGSTLSVVGDSPRPIADDGVINIYTLAIYDESVAVNADVVGVVDVDQLIIDGGSTYEAFYGNLSLADGALTLQVAADPADKIQLELRYDGELSEGVQVVLLTHVAKANFSLDGSTVTAAGNEVFTLKASDYFVGDAINTGTQLVYDSGTIYLTGVSASIPEPATATLSLLALAALAARRRRK